MNKLYIVALIVLIIGVLAEIVKSLRQRDKSQNPKFSYKLVWKFFNKSEEAFFLELKKYLPENYYVFPKVRIIDFIEPTRENYYSNKGRVWSRHVDFLICDFNFKPVIAIEVNGKSHQSQNRQDSDEFKKQLFEAVGLKYKFVQVGESFEEVIKNIFLEQNSTYYDKKT